MKQKKALRILMALAQETRLSIYKLLIQKGPDGIPAGQIAEALQTSAPTLSFHLSQLAGAGLITAQKEGRMIRYAANQKAIKNLSAYITENSYKKQQKALAAISASEVDSLIPPTSSPSSKVK